MSNQCILFLTDNEFLVHVINKQTCKDKALMFFVRKLVSICLYHNIVFKAKHIPGTHNSLADALSRLQVQTFRQLAPAMDPLPTEIPQHLSSIGVGGTRAFLKNDLIPTQLHTTFHLMVIYMFFHILLYYL